MALALDVVRVKTLLHLIGWSYIIYYKSRNNYIQGHCKALSSTTFIPAFVGDTRFLSTPDLRECYSFVWFYCTRASTQLS